MNIDAQAIVKKTYIAVKSITKITKIGLIFQEIVLYAGS